MYLRLNHSEGYVEEVQAGVVMPLYKNMEHEVIYEKVEVIRLMVITSVYHVTSETQILTGLHVYMHCKVQNMLQASIAPLSLKGVLHYYGNHTYFLGDAMQFLRTQTKNQNINKLIHLETVIFYPQMFLMAVCLALFIFSEFSSTL